MLKKLFYRVFRLTCSRSVTSFVKKIYVLYQRICFGSSLLHTFTYLMATMILQMIKLSNIFRIISLNARDSVIIYFFTFFLSS